MITIMVMIFFLSHQPGDFVPLPQFPGLDKSAHILVYGCLAASILYFLQSFPAFAENRTLTVIITVLFCLLYGVSDEYHQSFIPGRFVSIWDVAADGFGALLAAGIWSIITAGRGRRFVLTRGNKKSFH